MGIDVSWDVLNKTSIIFAVTLPVLTAVFYGVRSYWKKCRKIKHLESVVKSLEKGCVSKYDNLLFDAVLPNVEAAKAKLLEIMSGDSETNRTLRIDNFGLDLETISSLFRYTLNLKSRDRDVVYRGLVIDPCSESIKKICGGNSNLCQDVAKRAILALENADLTSGTELNIELYSYDTPPVIHGFLVDDTHLMIGFTYFDAGGLVGGTTPYLYIKRDKNSPFKEGIFKAYQTWFEFWLKNGVRKVSSADSFSSLHH